MHVSVLINLLGQVLPIVRFVMDTIINLHELIPFFVELMIYYVEEYG